jgi:hypothetical protein
VIRAGELANAFAALLRERRRDLAEATAALKAWMSMACDSLLDSFVRGRVRLLAHDPVAMAFIDALISSVDRK